MIFPRSLLPLPAALLLLLAAGSAVAQQAETPPRIIPQLSARTLSPGDQAVLAYQITGGIRQEVEDYPQMIVTPELSVTFRGTSRRLVSLNGEAAAVTEIRYLVQPEKSGTYTIPPQTFRVSGQDITAPAVTVEVKESPAVAGEMTPSAQLTLGKTEMWKGEVVPVEVAVLIHPAVQPAGQFVAQLKSTGFAVNRFDRQAGMDQRIINGEPWRVWQVESAMTPLQPGVRTFGPAQVEMDVFMPLAGGGGFLRDPYGSMSSASSRKSLKISSNSIDINVRELPAEGRPEGFSGAVGNFSLEITATPTVLKVGEPIAVEMVIDGLGNFDALTAPPLESKTGWRAYEPRVAQENRGLGTEPGRRSYTQILIPEKNLTEIPSFVLNFFDPVKGVYVTKKSPPVALTVTGDAAAPATASEIRDFNAASEAAVPGEELSDILSKPLSGGPWISTAAVPVPASPWLLHGVPAALLALILGTGAARRLRAAAAARRPASGAPRPAAEILAGLRRTPVSRREFYALTTEYLESVSFYSRKPLPASPEFTALLTARDRCLYGPVSPENEAALPDAERKSVLKLLPPAPPAP